MFGCQQNLIRAGSDTQAILEYLCSEATKLSNCGTYFLPMPSNLDFQAIREYRILPRNGCFYLEFVYKTTDIQALVDPAKCLMIDHGVDNWLTCVSNAGTSFIIDGKH
jgi:hypothetical protein